ncbi:flagellar hook-associated protein 3 FlgL [Anaerovibrio lipolyticus DSM 3074]|uniref:Flagellar hook-associated protein 3 FlgL n=1 Tax=Anaerovibrio lipolyticus DSM 3074 TaxID=1120997 RepID=A0A1M6EEP7_9FIRM|nr:flagellar hook-associated protein FlgL [Anaerovibrio lipolyticus]SHI83952.1 flagellar hook-associated protein 3 FlgL [Anaerovibrio lipolyticus DSM 3074]
MRISSTMMTNNYLKQLNGSYERYTKLFEQSDGKKLHRASDDAVGYSKYLRYKNSLTNVEQFQEDITTAVSWMKNSDAALVNVTERMKEFKGKVVAAGNSTNNENDMKDIAKELLASVQEVVSDMNAQIGDRYLFSGQSDTTMPFSISSEKKSRGETKTLSDNQAKFFNTVNDEHSVTQMLKLVDSTNENNVFYLNVKDGKVYTKDFVENGYKDKVAEGRTVADGDESATIAAWDATSGSEKVSKYFDEYGVINSDGESYNVDITVGGETVNLKFATTKQYIVSYEGDAKYISMVKKTGGVDKATDTVNQTGQDVFGSDIFDAENTPGSGTAMLNELLYAVAKIDSADNHWAAEDGLTISDAAHSQVLGAQTTMAARQQAYSAASDMLVTQDESITSDITDVSSTDVAKLATQLMEYQTIYSLSLSVGSKILPGTLADYL